METKLLLEAKLKFMNKISDKMDNTFSWEQFERLPIIGILRNLQKQQAEKFTSYFVKANLSNIEITMNSENAEEIIASLIKKYGNKLNIGAGTVCSLDDLEKAIKAGAQFIVTPIVNEEVIKTCVDNGIPIFVGAFTPTEIFKGWSLGASMVKIFPATQLGPRYLKDLKAPLDTVKFLPTGGINSDNFLTFFQAGADGVGIGGDLVNKPMIEKEEWSNIFLQLKSFVKRYNEFKKRKNEN